MASTALVSCQWLADHLDDPNVRILEVGATPDLAVYAKGHIPGAQGVYWKTACWHETDREFISSGGDGKPVRRAWHRPASIRWCCTAIPSSTAPMRSGPSPWPDTSNLKLLDGSRKRWLADNRPMTMEVPRLGPVAYPTPSGETSMRVGRRNVRDNLKKPDRFLLDVRSRGGIHRQARDRVLVRLRSRRRALRPHPWRRQPVLSRAC